MTQWTRGIVAAMLLGLLLGLSSMAALAQEVAPINVNTADAELLTELPGVGPSRAEAIIEYREANGPFESADDLVNVSGIGASTVEGLQDQVEF
ncbi:ComEA family DNA-binding protein [Halomonas heilongjiangensis]|uniref:Competence protein ComEA n=1 Tax=Halomonas heilongjiangensis TaxID=1387883 RepID=A0A2N7THH5_9GAMM|nr:helix-hairpin-helix domain-containing protein [Halomonas heilongjiangensis]PMR67641.1 competence protein ComEA [Halomonas heilongjiangensis]PXX92092.1 competence protein ComEA [Halomonas heilongjiangensis]